MIVIQTAEIMSRVRNTFGDEAKVQISDEMLLDWINDAINDLSNRLDFGQTKASTDLVANTSVYALPNDVVEVYSVSVNGIALPYVTLNDFNRECGYGYTTYNHNIAISPMPSINKVNGLVIWYAKLPPRIISPMEFPAIPDIYHPRLVEYALAQAYLFDDDIEKYGLIMGRYSTITTSQIDAFPAETYPSVSGAAYD